MASKSGSGWTAQENKRFEEALAAYGEKDPPERWERMAAAVGNKSVEEIKRHYQRLVEDIALIESGKVPLPNYIR